MDHQGYFRIGYFTKTRGLKGELQLFFDFEDPELLELDSIYVEIDRQLVPFFVGSYRLQANQTGYFFIDDIDHIDQAKNLVHKSIFLPDDRKPVRNDDEFYMEDLKGFEVIESTHGNLGIIEAIDEYPQQYIATVFFNSKQVMFPLSDDFITTVDEEKKELYVSLPEGLIDIYLS
ncbi:ribosome maturation factor RimM [Albibacterium indicum]|uniref:ribosome maturation factor RimM n=1 Tax=Albibacterium indicum TaxID=2292082 RepID=UPI000E4E973B|nr:ribosome maturation factor RimM [Pedobacter indicus]